MGGRAAGDSKGVAGDWGNACSARHVDRPRSPRSSVASLITVAVACSGDDDSGTAAPGTTSGESSPPTTEASTTTTESAEPTTTKGGGSTSAPATTTAGTTPVTLSAGESRPEDPPNPVQGGTLVYGLEADSANPWAPYKVSCVTSCLAVLRGITDSLFGYDPDGQMVPYLVESVEHNADYTQWTLHIRDGIKFHDGTALDAAAVKFNIDACRASPLTATAYLPIDTIEASGQDVTLNLRGGAWTALPAYFGYAQCGFMFSRRG